MDQQERKNQTIQYLGIDWGSRRIGLALASSETGLAVPFKVVDSFSQIKRIVQEEKIDKIILGRPVKMSGSGLAEEFKDFCRQLGTELTVPLELIDERLSSKAADALAGGKKVKAARDAIAAMLILQGYLDQRRK